MTEDKTTQKRPSDLERFLEERRAATFLRDDLWCLVGYLEAKEEGHISKRLQEMLDKHLKLRCQWWL